MTTDKKKPLSLRNTKQDLLEAYEGILKELKQTKATELNPGKQREEKEQSIVIETAKSNSEEAIAQNIGLLKNDISNFLDDIHHKLETSVEKFLSLEKAIKFKEEELKEIYGIEKEANGLAALIETCKARKAEFELEMEEREISFEDEVKSQRDAWIKEKKQHDDAIKERDAEDKKLREREKEDFYYQFNREKQQKTTQLNDELASLEKEIALKKEAADKDFAQREENLNERENELKQLRQKADKFPTELETSIKKSVKEAVEQEQLLAKSRYLLLEKEKEGEQKVYEARLSAMDKTIEEQNNRIISLASQHEVAYQKVQDIAVRAVEGSANVKGIADLQKMLGEAIRKSPEK